MGKNTNGMIALVLAAYAAVLGLTEVVGDTTISSAVLSVLAMLTTTDHGGAARRYGRGHPRGRPLVLCCARSWPSHTSFVYTLEFQPNGVWPAVTPPGCTR